MYIPNWNPWHFPPPIQIVVARESTPANAALAKNADTKSLRTQHIKQTVKEYTSLHTPHHRSTSAGAFLNQSFFENVGPALSPPAITRLRLLLRLRGVGRLLFVDTALPRRLCL